MTKTSTEVAVQPEAQLPALAGTPSALGNIDSRDVTLPRLYKGEYQSSLVQDDTVPKGSIFVATGADDPDPQVIWKLGDTEGVLVHVLSAHKGKSCNLDDAGNLVKSGGTFTTFAYEDTAAPDGCNVDFHYVVVLPEVDPDVPVKLTMSKTSVPAARKINFLLLKNQERPLYNLAFRLNTLAREKSADGQKYKWFVWQGRQVEAVEANVALAAKVAAMVNTSRPTNDIERTSSDAPAI